VLGGPDREPVETHDLSPEPAARAVDRLRPMVPPASADHPLLLVTDFDGTIAHPLTDPWGAAIVPSARRALRELAGRPDVCVCLLSGRAVTDLAPRVRVGGARYLGNHGTEGAWLPRGARAESLRPSSVGRRAVDPETESLVRRLADGVPDEVPAPWLVVERKLPVAVTFHFRAAPDLEAARSRVHEAVEHHDPGGRLVRHYGRRMMELRDPQAATKGQALERLLADVRPSVAVMLGDDRHDALALAALRRWRDEGNGLALAIAVAGHADVTREVARSADLVLDGPDEAARFLTGLADLMRRHARPARRLGCPTVSDLRLPRHPG
jgi:trehalose 6-phosphate phosphatase